MKPIKRAFLDTEDGQILYRIGGEGESLLLLHMTPRSSDEFRELMPIFAQNRCAIAMDLMGLGDSDKPPRMYSIPDYAQTIIALLDELDINKTSLLGNHTGAYVAAEVAAAYPERIEKLILCNIDKFGEEEKTTLVNRVSEALQIKENSSDLVARWSVRDSYVGSQELNHRCFLDEMKCYGHPPYGTLAATAYTSIIQERLGLIKCPTLILSGTEDIKVLKQLSLSKPENRQMIAQAIPQAKMLEIEGGSFCMMNQMPEEISRVVVDFLEGEGD
ncbi:MAG: alpha/beta hydrolase [Symploca sp. SIO1B1]|nr:alpha/beta hydrolase [Symploca sp. SIO1C2]NER96021.1 alpha/beta hydrolase [Symploca sp. SIO1B1]